MVDDLRCKSPIHVADDRQDFVQIVGQVIEPIDDGLKSGVHSSLKVPKVSLRGGLVHVIHNTMGKEVVGRLLAHGIIHSDANARRFPDNRKRPLTDVAA